LGLLPRDRFCQAALLLRRPQAAQPDAAPPLRQQPECGSGSGGMEES